uniref:Uncharacterized protein n=1 Tax=Avena sativa TaxID=4498 RepID=A0ACD5Y3W0_AVESA
MEAQMQLNTLVANMFATGLLDDQFQQLQMFQARNAPGFIAEIVTIFCNEGRRNIDELAKMLERPCVDFKEVGDILFKLMGSSASIGAQRVNNICIQFREFYEEKSRDGCLKAFHVMRKEFYDTCIKFQTMLQLEQQVWTFYPNQ